MALLRSEGSNSPSRSTSLDRLEDNQYLIPIRYLNDGYVRFDGVNVVRQVNQGSNVDGKLSKHRANDIDVEDIWLGPFFRQTFHGLQEY